MSKKSSRLNRFKFVGGTPRGTAKESILVRTLEIVKGLPDDVLLDYNELTRRLSVTKNYGRRLSEFVETEPFRALVPVSAVRKIFWGNEKTIKALREAMNEERKGTNQT